MAAGALVVGLSLTACGDGMMSDTADTATTDTGAPVQDTNVVALYGVADTSGQ